MIDGVIFILCVILSLMIAWRIFTHIPGWWVAMKLFEWKHWKEGLKCWWIVTKSFLEFWKTDKEDE